MLRAQFFSSIAHELRTPLNSVIPILKLILALLSSGQVPVDMVRVTKLLNVVHNGTIHLQNVINDALDITRLENNKFDI